jgi:hypothetical protein
MGLCETPCRSQNRGICVIRGGRGGIRAKCEPFQTVDPIEFRRLLDDDSIVRLRFILDDEDRLSIAEAKEIVASFGTKFIWGIDENEVINISGQEPIAE